MTTVAQKFITELQAGKISEAIDTIKAGLQESQTKLFEQKRQEVLASYGFVVSEKKVNEEDDDKMDDEKDEKEDDEKDDSSDNGMKKKEEEDEKEDD